MIGNRPAMRITHCETPRRAKIASTQSKTVRQRSNIPQKIVQRIVPIHMRKNPLKRRKIMCGEDPRNTQIQTIHRPKKPNPPTNQMHAIRLKLRNRLAHLPPSICPRRIFQRKMRNPGKLCRHVINRTTRNNIQFT